MRHRGEQVFDYIDHIDFPYGISLCKESVQCGMDSECVYDDYIPKCVHKLFAFEYHVICDENSFCLLIGTLTVHLHNI